MRFTTTPTVNSPLTAGDEIKGLYRTTELQNQYVQHEAASKLQQYRQHAGQRMPNATEALSEEERRDPIEDRRKVNQRIRKQNIPLELRSGRDRRRNHNRATDIVERVDIKA